MQTAKSYAEILAWEQARVGLSGLPREWTPANWTNHQNDCAVFQSSAFYGDMRYYVVSQFYNDGAAHGQLIASARPGAFACFRWPGSGDNFDHIGLVISTQDKHGNFQTIEANTSGPVSGHQVAVKTRNVANVVGFVMPAYEVGKHATPVPPHKPKKWNNKMYGIVKGDKKATVYAVRLSDLAVKPLATQGQLAAYASAGYVLSVVAQADCDALVAAAPAW